MRYRRNSKVLRTQDDGLSKGCGENARLLTWAPSQETKEQLFN